MNTADNDNDMSACANCGKSEEESGKLKACTACKMVKYCNRDCQIAHRPQHKKECRKRTKELHDEELFKEPQSQHEDCQICFLQLPTLISGWKYQACCGKVICSGCICAPVYDNHGNEVAEEKCPYCRTPHPESDKEAMEREKKRLEASDPIAVQNLGNYFFHGRNGYPQDYTKALEQWHLAGELGYARAYCNIGYAYQNGEGVEVDKKKANHYFELGALAGDEGARHNLGIMEGSAGNMERALKHLTIAVQGGYSESLDVIQELYSDGYATKEDYTKALRAYQE